MKLIQQEIFDHTGIIFSDSKNYLIKSRLYPLIQKYGLVDFDELALKLKSQPKDGEILLAFIDAVTTHETSFFREFIAFEMIKEVILPNFKEKSGSLNILSAASSTGQEAYSILIYFKKHFPKIFEKTLIDGIDISQNSITKATKGIYNSIEVSRGINASDIHKYFTIENRNFHVLDLFKQKTNFFSANLLEAFNAQQYDIIFCRNISIYFNEENKKKLFYNVSNHLKAGGYLIVGAAEIVDSYIPNSLEKQQFQRFRFYKKK